MLAVATQAPFSPDRPFLLCRPLEMFYCCWAQSTHIAFAFPSSQSVPSSTTQLRVNLSTGSALAASDTDTTPNIRAGNTSTMLFQVSSKRNLSPPLPFELPKLRHSMLCFQYCISFFTIATFMEGMCNGYGRRETTKSQTKKLLHCYTTGTLYTFSNMNLKPKTTPLFDTPAAREGSIDALTD